jgi:hypothetical protein
MPDTKTKRPTTKRRAAAKRSPAANKDTAAHRVRSARRELDARKVVERSTELSEEVLKSLDDGARSAIDAVRKFADTVDRALPRNGKGASKREEITDSALELAQRLLHTQAEFPRRVVDDAGKTLSGSSDAK